MPGINAGRGGARDPIGLLGSNLGRWTPQLVRSPALHWRPDFPLATWKGSSPSWTSSINMPRPSPRLGRTVAEEMGGPPVGGRRQARPMSQPGKMHQVLWGQRGLPSVCPIHQGRVGFFSVQRLLAFARSFNNSVACCIEPVN